MIRRLAKLGFAFGLLAHFALGQTAGSATGTIQVVVFTADAGGGRSVLPAAKISLDGTTHVETRSNDEGKFVFSAIPAGSYTITAQAPGMAARHGALVTRGTASQVELEMKLQAVAESTTVTASAEPADTKELSGTNTVT
jgi:Carboxypeptidase regulatory-like domain